mmetsp:Transcript_31169/g.101619  ORF Transcript_31169/g.101619 Transcript_31169/m.101619 type:complete len:500 (+) Transcript_31169:808-2307(+)
MRSRREIPLIGGHRRRTRRKDFHFIIHIYGGYPRRRCSFFFGVPSQSHLLVAVGEFEEDDGSDAEGKAEVGEVAERLILVAVVEVAFAPADHLRLIPCERVVVIAEAVRREHVHFLVGVVPRPRAELVDDKRLDRVARVRDGAEQHRGRALVRLERGVDAAEEAAEDHGGGDAAQHSLVGRDDGAEHVRHSVARPRHEHARVVVLGEAHEGVGERVEDAGVDEREDDDGEEVDDGVGEKVGENGDAGGALAPKEDAIGAKGAQGGDRGEQPEREERQELIVAEREDIALRALDETDHERANHKEKDAEDVLVEGAELAQGGALEEHEERLHLPHLVSRRRLWERLAQPVLLHRVRRHGASLNLDAAEEESFELQRRLEVFRVARVQRVLVHRLFCASHARNEGEKLEPVERVVSRGVRLLEDQVFVERVNLRGGPPAFLGGANQKVVNLRHRDGLILVHIEVVEEPFDLVHLRNGAPMQSSIQSAGFSSAGSSKSSDIK